MHPHDKIAEAVSAPAEIQRVKNLIEDFFGLTVADGPFYPHSEEDLRRAPGQPAVNTFTCSLRSPTGRALDEFDLSQQLSDSWVRIQCRKGFLLNNWQKVLQTAIDNFVNAPKGVTGVLGDWMPDPARLQATRE